MLYQHRGKPFPSNNILVKYWRAKAQMATDTDEKRLYMVRAATIEYGYYKHDKKSMASHRLWTKF